MTATPDDGKGWDMRGLRVTVFGGSGFLGRHLVQRLAAGGALVRVAVRDPEAAAFLKPLGDVGQIVPFAADIGIDRSVQAAVAGADVVVNLVGILYERGGRTFRRIHVEGAGRVAKAAAAAGVKRLVHISALGASLSSSSAYARSKAQGEKAVQKAFPDVVIFRPSVVFGPEDQFFNRFAGLMKLTPVLPIFGPTPGPTSIRAHRGIRVDGPRFQPVYVGDVGDAIVKAIEEGITVGIYELAGPRVYTMREILELVMRETRRRRILFPMPYWAATLQATILQFLPNPPLTPDQVEMLKKDNVATGKLPGFADLGIVPTAPEAIVAFYLARYRPPALADRGMVL